MKHSDTMAQSKACHMMFGGEIECRQVCVYVGVRGSLERAKKELSARPDSNSVSLRRSVMLQLTSWLMMI